MANLTSVDLTNGVPSAGTGTVSTLDNLIGSAGTPAGRVLSVQGAPSGTPLGVSAATPLPVSAPSPLPISAPSPIGITAATALPVAASPETSTVYNGSVATTPSFAPIVASASGATTLVAAVSGKRIRVLALTLTANAAVNLKLQSHATPTDLSGLFYMAAQGDGVVLPFSPVGWCQTNVGEALDINLSAAVAVGGMLVYVAL
jgi:hypothetical protein